MRNAGGGAAVSADVETFEKRGVVVRTIGSWRRWCYVLPVAAAYAALELRCGPPPGIVGAVAFYATYVLAVVGAARLGARNRRTHRASLRATPYAAARIGC